MNLFGVCKMVDFVVMGLWLQKLFGEVKKFCMLYLVVSGKMEVGFMCVFVCVEWQLLDDLVYVYLCINEMIDGVEMFEILDFGDVLLVVDVLLYILLCLMDVVKYGVLFGGVQKNIGMVGVMVVIVCEDLFDCVLLICLFVFEWKIIVVNNLLYNMLFIYVIYIVGFVFQWLKWQGGFEVIEVCNIEKLKLFYDMIDVSSFYLNKVELVVCLWMNVLFFLVDEMCNEDFFVGVKVCGLLQLKGYKFVGGMWVLIYNVVLFEGVKVFVEYMKDFEQCGV